MTNLPPETFTPDDILCLQRLRWQIELLFKLWKSDLSLDEWRSQLPHQILSEVYAKLLLALIQHWLLLLGCWQHENRSLVKAAKVLRKHAFHILAALPNLTSLLFTCVSFSQPLLDVLYKKEKHAPPLFSFWNVFLLNLMPMARLLMKMDKLFSGQSPEVEIAEKG